MPPSELERAEALMRREAYRKAGAQARSLGVPRNKNPFERPAVNESEQEMLAVLASHWRDGVGYAATAASTARASAAGGIR
jgi:hypothetical protein